jgi:hypothetical protein
MLGIGKDLGTKESQDMVDDNVSGFVCKVRVVNAETGIKPIDFIGHELARHKSLAPQINQRVVYVEHAIHTLAATSA